MWRPQFHQRFRDDTGAAAVEFALIFPILAIMLFGTVEVGAMYNAQLLVTSGARDAARTMAIDNDTALAKTAAIAAAPGVTLTSSEIAIAPAACAAGTNVSVTITHTQPLITGFFGISVPLVGKATRRCNG